MFSEPFAADATVALRQQRRREQRPANTPHENRGDKAADVLQDAAADHDQVRPAPAATIEQPREDRLRRS